MFSTTGAGAVVARCMRWLSSAVRVSREAHLPTFYTSTNSGIYIGLSLEAWGHHGPAKSPGQHHF